MAQIPFDVYFKDTLIGDASIQMDESGNPVAIDSTSILKNLPPLLKGLGVINHPIQQKPFKGRFVPIKKWAPQLALLPSVDLNEFKIQLELPPAYRPIESVRLSERKATKQSTISPADQHGWMSLSGMGSFSNQTTQHLTSWRGGYGAFDWNFLANGALSAPEDFIQSWRVERDLYDERIHRLQLGFIQPPQMINGQLSLSQTFGIALSNSLNQYTNTNVLAELPGGVIELTEDSTVEIYKDAFLFKKIALPAGRYRISDLVVRDGVQFIDVRIITISGRITQRRLKIESFPAQPAPDEIEYSLFMGGTPSARNPLVLNPSIGFGVYRGFGEGLAAGLHATSAYTDGYRLGLFAEKLLSSFSVDMVSFWQNMDRDPLKGSFELYANVFDFMGLSGSAIFNWFGNNALSNAHRYELLCGFNPRIKNTEIARLDVGKVKQFDNQEGYSARLSRSWALGPHINIMSSLSLNTLTPSLQAVISFSVAPEPDVSFQVAQNWGTVQNSQIGASFQRPEEGWGLATSYTSLTPQSPGNLNLLAGFEHHAFKTAITSNWQENKPSELGNNVTSFAYETTLLFADGSFALTSSPSDTFAVIDASAFQSARKLKININGKELPGINGHVAVPQLTPFQSNALVIDPSDISYAYPVQEETLTPKPAQVFRIYLKPEILLEAAGTLLFPDGSPVPLATGELRHISSGKIKEWFTGDDGSFTFEASPGTWRGSVLWDDKKYELEIYLDSSQSTDGVLLLGPISLSIPRG